MNIKHIIDLSDDNPVTSWNDVKACGFVDGYLGADFYIIYSIDRFWRGSIRCLLNMDKWLACLCYPHGF